MQKLLSERFNIKRFLKLLFLTILFVLILCSGVLIFLHYRYVAKVEKIEKNNNEVYDNVNIRNSTSVSHIDGTEIWMTYNNINHGYKISYPISFDMLLSGDGDPMDWFQSTCISIAPKNRYFAITIQRKDYSDYCYKPDKTATPNHGDSYELKINDELYIVDGIVSDDKRPGHSEGAGLAGLYSVDIGDELGVFFEIRNSSEKFYDMSDKDYQKIYQDELDLIHKILGTLEITSDFEPTHPPILPISYKEDIYFSDECSKELGWLAYIYDFIGKRCNVSTSYGR